MRHCITFLNDKRSYIHIVPSLSEQTEHIGCNKIFDRMVNSIYNFLEILKGFQAFVTMNTLL